MATKTRTANQPISRRAYYLSPAFLTYLLVWILVKAYMVLAGFISFGHLIHSGHLLGMNPGNARMLPWVIDGLFFIGMIGRHPHFAAATRRKGTYIALGAGLLSLAGNMYAGQTIGDSFFGALVVGAFLVAEWFSAKLAPARRPRAVDPQTAAEREAARRAARRATMTPAQKRADTIAEKKAAQDAEIRQMAAGHVPDNAPTSPAVGYTGAFTG